MLGNPTQLLSLRQWLNREHKASLGQTASYGNEISTNLSARNPTQFLPLRQWLDREPEASLRRTAAYGNDISTNLSARKPSMLAPSLTEAGLCGSLKHRAIGSSVTQLCPVEFPSY